MAILIPGFLLHFMSLTTPITALYPEMATASALLLLRAQRLTSRHKALGSKPVETWMASQALWQLCCARLKGLTEGQMQQDQVGGITLFFK